MELKWKKSEQVEGSFEANLAVTLLSVGEKSVENKNGTLFHGCTVKLEDGQTVSAIMYEGNYSKGVEVNTRYLAKAIYNPSISEDALIQVSHLIAANRANIATLGFNMDEIIETDELAQIAKEAKVTVKKN
jgi:hypothetical protein